MSQLDGGEILSPFEVVHETRPAFGSTQLSRSRRAARFLSASEEDYRKFLSSRLAGLSPKQREQSLPLMLNTHDAANIEPPPWLIEGILPKRSLAIIYGREGQGKSFLILEMLFSIARGIDFLGLPTSAGPCLYIVSEGIGGIGKRVRAYLTAKTKAGIVTGLAIPLTIIPEALPLNTTDGLERLLLCLDDLGVVPACICIDTLHACIPTADENDASEMGQFIQIANSIRTISGCTVIIVHHARKAGDAYRGHSSLAGDVDTMIRVSSEDFEDKQFIRLSCSKQKDAAPFDDFFVELAPYKLPNGDSSCIIAEVKKGVEVTQQEQHIIDILRQHPEGIRCMNLLKLSQMSESAFLRWRIRLLEKKIITISDSKIHLDPQWSGGKGGGSPIKSDLEPS